MNFHYFRSPVTFKTIAVIAFKPDAKQKRQKTRDPIDASDKEFKWSICQSRNLLSDQGTFRVEVITVTDR